VAGKSKNNILGIDISSKSTGIAIITSKEILVRTHVIKNPHEQESGEYYTRIKKTLTYFIRKYNVSHVVMEDLNIRFLKSGKKILPIHGVVKQIAFELLRKEATCFNVSTWRFTILGLKKFTDKEKREIKKKCKTQKEFKIRANIKNKVIEYVNYRMNTYYDYDDNDITDALGLTLAYLDNSKR